MLERRAFARERLDHLRRFLMLEPRGHADMYGAVLLPPAAPDGDCGVLFLHNEGFSTMCGHGIIALTTVLVETGRAGAEIRYDTPAGRVVARAHRENGRVRSVRFANVESFVEAAEQRVDVPGIGTIRYDLAFGGAYYAYCDAAELGVGLGERDAGALIEAGMRVKRAVMARGPVGSGELGYLYGTIISGPPHGTGAHLRNVCIFADGQVDRSPTGTGVSGRLAIEHARGRLLPGEPFVVESILGTRFTGRVLAATARGVVPEVEGRAWITGSAEFVWDEEDPLNTGFRLR
jgi:trans-L-3-hydroxyproline dehydratase